MKTFTEFLDDCVMQPLQTESEQELKHAAFCYANASLTLEGLEPDSAQLARQEEIIQGRLTTEQAIVQCLAEYT